MCCVRGVLRAARCGRRTSRKRARGDGGLGARCVAARWGARGCACARVMSRRRAMLRYGRRAKRTARNVLRAWCAAHRAVRSGVCVWSEARNVMRAWRVARCAARSTREPEASARRRRAEGPQRRGASGRSWSRVRVCVERAARNVLRAKRGAQWLRAWCAAHCAVRSAREPEASARRRRAGSPRVQRRRRRPPHRATAECRAVANAAADRAGASSARERRRDYLYATVFRRKARVFLSLQCATDLR